MDQTGVSLVAQGADAFGADMKRAENAVTGFVKTADDGGSRIGAAGQVMIGALRQVGTIAVQALAQAAKATAAFVGDSIGLAGDFQAGMLEFQSVAGKDVDTSGLEKFHDLFLQLGKELPVSTADVQKAAIEMVKGGIDPATIAAGGLKDTILFAAAAMGGDLVAAAEVSAKVVGGWADVNATAAEKAVLLAHAQDVLTKAANASTVGVDDLALGLYNVQGTAKAMGVGLDETITTLAELAPNFSNANTAGTAYRNFLIRLQPTTDAATAAMQSLGLITADGTNKFFDAQGQFVGTAAASQLLQEAFVGLTDQQKTSLTQTIFGNDAMNAAVALADRGAAGYDNMTASLANANGVAEAGALKQQGYNIALENAKGSVEALQIQLGEKLLPILTDLLNNYIAPGINTLSTFADAVFGNDDAFKELSPTMQGIVTVIDVLVADVQEIIGAFEDAGAGSSEFGEAIGLLASDLGMPGDLIEQIVFAIQDLIPVFSDAGDSMSSLKDTSLDDFGVIGEYIPSILKSIQTITDTVLKNISQFWDENGAEISAFVKSAWDTIQEIVGVVLTTIVPMVAAKLKAMADFISTHGKEIQTAMKGAWDIISGIVTVALGIIKGVIETVMALIRGDWQGAWDAMSDAVAMIVGGIKKIIGGALDIIAAGFGTTMAKIEQTWRENWDLLVSIAGKVVARMIAIGSDIVAGIKSGISGAWNSLMSWVRDKINQLPEAVRIALGISSPSKVFAEIGEFSMQGLLLGFQTKLPDVLSSLRSMGDDIASAAQDIGDQINEALSSGFSSEASIDRAKLANLRAMDELSKQSKATAELQLAEAERIAGTMADPKQAAAFYKMRSDQILELAKLQDKIDAATDAKERTRLITEWQLAAAAGDAELKAFQASTANQQNPLQAIMDQIQALLKPRDDGKPLDDPDGALAALFKIYDALAVSQGQASVVNPPAGPGETGGAGGSSFSYTRNLNMPIYTNNTAAAIQQSAAIANAIMP